VIPQRAFLERTVEVTITQAGVTFQPPADLSPLSGAYTIGPPGLTFDKPAYLAIKLDTPGRDAA
jgi:hypothetical protein